MATMHKTPAQSVGAEVTALFRTKRVSEIRQIESHVRSEAEDKAEALRDLLGTRYKDLLHAADSVVTVRDASKKRVTNALGALAESSSELRAHFLRQAAVSPKTGAPDDVERRRREQAVAARLKHIVDSTEALYAHLEHSRLYDAAARLAAAERNYKALEEHGGAVARFAATQWRGVAQFRGEVRAAAQDRLVKDGLLVDEYARVVSALIVLHDGTSAAPKVLRNFLGARSAAVRKELTVGGAAMDARMREVAMLVKATVAAVADMLHAKKGVVISLISEADAEVAKAVAADMDGEKLHYVCVPWLGDVRQILESDGRTLLDGVNTARELATALMDVDDILVDEDWAEACSTVLGLHPRAVFDVFEPVISERANVVSKESVEHVSTSIDKCVQEEWTGINGSADTGKNVWSTVTQQSLYQSDESTEEAAHMKGGMVNLLSASGPAARIRDTLTSTLGTALNDAKYISERVPSVSVTFTRAVFETTPKIVHCLVERVDVLIRSVQRAASDMSYSDREQLAERALLCARVAGTMLASTALEEAFHFEQVMQADKQKLNHCSEYKSFCTELNQVSKKAYELWARQVCTPLHDRLREDLRTCLVATTRLVDEGEEVDSDTVVYPRTASVAASRFCAGACAASNAAGGPALPRRALHALANEMRTVLADAYSTAAESGGAGSGDERHLQMMFDLRYVAATLVSDADGRLTKLARRVESRVDPVDLASCGKGLAAAVSAHAARTAVLLGALLDTSSVTNDTYIASAEAANLAVLAPVVPRFTYLPAPMPSTYTLGSAGSASAGLSARAAVEQLRKDTAAAAAASPTNTPAHRRHDLDAALGDVANKVTDTVGRLGSRFLGSFMG